MADRPILLTVIRHQEPDLARLATVLVAFARYEQQQRDVAVPAKGSDDR